MERTLRDRLASVPTRVGLATMDRAAHVLARLRYALPDVHPSRFDLAVKTNVPYGDDALQRLDVYMPTRAGSRLPVVMYVHGGGFAMLSKDTHRLMAFALARAGYLLFNIDYRHGLRHPYPTPIEDACRALLWVKDNCARYGGDPGRIALAGESAGGNLVTALAVASSWRRPEELPRRVFDANLGLRAVVSNYGFLDLGHTAQYLANPRMPRWAKGLLVDAARSYVGDDHAAVERSPLASPLRILEAGKPDRPLPAFFAAVGTRDPLLRCSKRLKAAVDALGGSCELHLSPGEIHGYDAFMWRPMAKEKWRATHAFLERTMAPSRPGRVRDARDAWDATSASAAGAARVLDEPDQRIVRTA
jgi:acetyl esterase